jgi:hypothetical protein
MPNKRLVTFPTIGMFRVQDRRVWLDKTDSSPELIVTNGQLTYGGYNFKLHSLPAAILMISHKSILDLFEVLMRCHDKLAREWGRGNRLS